MTGSGQGSPPFVAADLELWVADLDRLAGPLTVLDARAPLLCDDERGHLDGARCIARLALRLLLARAFGADIARAPFRLGAHGKPSLPGLTGDFNLAHAGALALIGLGTTSVVGVDLERAREIRMTAARRAAIGEAALRIADGAPLPNGEAAGTLQAWARLEALAKADGHGIGRTLSRLGVWGRPAGHATSKGDLAADSARADLLVHDVAVAPGLYAAVALPRGVAPPAVQHLPAGIEALAAIRAGALLSPDSGVDLASAPRQKGHVGA